MVSEIEKVINANVYLLNKNDKHKVVSNHKGQYVEYKIETNFKFSIVIQHEILDNWFNFNISYNNGASYIRADDNKFYQKQLRKYLRVKYGLLRSNRKYGNEEGIIGFIFMYVQNNLELIQDQEKFLSYLDKIRYIKAPKVI